VPFTIAGKGIESEIKLPLSEANAEKTGFKINKGSDLMEFVLSVK
jgi:hypothetical protein